MTAAASHADRFWDALGVQQEWFTRPQVMYDDGELIWKMTAKEGYLFDDAFWQVFQSFPFTICHVSYSGAPWSQEGGPPEMVIRFAPKSEEAGDYPNDQDDQNQQDEGTFDRHATEDTRNVGP